MWSLPAMVGIKTI